MSLWKQWIITNIVEQVLILQVLLGLFLWVDYYWDTYLLWGVLFDFFRIQHYSGQK